MKLQGFILSIFLFLTSFSFASAMEVSGTSAILIEQSTGSVLYGKNEHTRLPMASTTKIMTAIVAIEEGNPEDMVTISKHAAYTEGSSMYLHVGEQVRLESLLYGLMLNSGNDAAVAIAEHISGSEEGFAQRMNQKAESLGLTNTHFCNPNGLDEEEHYTTAYDLAQITRYGMQLPLFRKLVSTKTKQVELDGEAGKRFLHNHNKMLGWYEWCDGVKTGFTKKSGRCLVSSATRDGMQLIAVTLHAPDDWNDHKRMLDYGFSQYEIWSPEVPKQTVMVENGKTVLTIVPSESFTMLIAKKEKELCQMEISVSPRLQAPVMSNQEVGEVVFRKGESIVHTVKLIAENTVEAEYIKPNFWAIFMGFWHI